MPVERATSPMKMMAGLNRAPYLSLSKINVRSPGVRVRPRATLAAETARAVVEAVSANSAMFGIDSRWATTRWSSIS